MTFAIYGRKSVYRDTSDSIKSQIRMCKERLSMKVRGGFDTVEYFDEGVSGATADRPQLNAMINDIELGLINGVVVYQLDRLSRNIKDFVNLYSKFGDYGVDFISVKEDIDTSTPSGRMMMYIIAAFAQMERETIAARISDNLVTLAMAGFWSGGKTPIGYKNHPVVVGGKKHASLIPDEEYADFIKEVFEKFVRENLSYGKLQKMIPEFKGRLYNVLTNAVYVQNTKEVYDYFKDMGCNMYGEWDGTKGVIVYGKKGPDKTKRPPEEWHVAAGIHEPIVPAETWLKVQEVLKGNVFDKTSKYEKPMLKGIIRCKQCGCTMNVLRNKKNVYYRCGKRNRDKGCDNSVLLRADVAEELVLGVLKNIAPDHNLIWDFVSKDEDLAPKRNYTREINRLSKKINNLVNSLSNDSTAAKYILPQIEELDKQKTALEWEESKARREDKVRELQVQTIEEKAKEVEEFVNNFESFTALERIRVLKSLFTECTWDGQELFLRF